VLFYFREQRSIHLLPVLFDATTLREQLNRHTGNRTSIQPPPSNPTARPSGQTSD
jgi:hypothetical protein